MKGGCERHTYAEGGALERRSVKVGFVSRVWELSNHDRTFGVMR